MAKIIYQYMIEPKVYVWLEKQNKKSRHKTLSHTINWILKQNIMIEDMAEKETEKKPVQKKSIYEEMAEKYNLKKYGGKHD